MSENNYNYEDNIDNEMEDADPDTQLNEFRELKSSNKKDVDKINNNHYDEEVVVSNNESDDMLLESKGNKEGKNNFSDDDVMPKTNNDGTYSNQLPLPKFNIADFEKLASTNSDYKIAFSFMNRFQVNDIQLDSKLKPFIPSYIPSIGEVDAFLKPNKPDKSNEELGINIIDEPTIEGIDPDTFRLKLMYLKKNTGGYININIPTISNAEKNPKDIQSWIDKIADLPKTSGSVPYSKNMPKIEDLMQFWHEKMESAVSQFKLPDEKVNLSTDIYSKIVCNLLDIPIHKGTNNKSLIESLHVLFSLYSYVKENQAYKNIEKTENVQSIKYN